jgi:hypothetical protein
MIPEPVPVIPWTPVDAVMVVDQVTGSGNKFKAFSRVDISSWQPVMMDRLSFIF